MPRSRLTDPITSVFAADSVQNLTETKRAILGLLKHPATDEQLVNRYQAYARSGFAPMASPSGIRSRRNELTVAGYLEAVDYGKTLMGRKAIVWGVK